MVMVLFAGKISNIVILPLIPKTVEILLYMLEIFNKSAGDNKLSGFER